MKKKINDLFTFIQLVLGSIILILTLIFMIFNLFSDFYILIQSLLIVELALMAYNNYKICKRKYIAIIYLLSSLSLLVCLIFELINA